MLSFEQVKNCGKSKILVMLHSTTTTTTTAATKFSRCLLLQFTITAIIIRIITFRVGNGANVTSQLKLSLPVGLLFTFYVIVLICFFCRWQLSHLLLLQFGALGVLWEVRVRKERSVDFVSVSHLVQRQTATTAASQPTNGRMTTLLMNALIICVGGEVGVFMGLWQSFGVAAKQTPLFFKPQCTIAETHILNTCWLIRFFLSQSPPSPHPSSPMSLSVFPQRPNSIWRRGERRGSWLLSLNFPIVRSP